MPRTLAIALWIGGLGAVGSLLRAGMGAALGKWTGSEYMPTVIVNLLGCFAMGVIVTVVGPAPHTGRTPFSLGLTAGLLGGFTTYSGFAYQTVAQVERRAVAPLAMNVGITLVGCFVACAAGVATARWFGR
jgi:fluoride exporter